MSDEAQEIVVEPAEPAERANEVDQVRDLILTAYRDVVPELIGGATISDVMASVEVARSAYREVRERIVALAPATAAASPPPPVPAGAGVAIVDPATLPTHELIRRGIEGRRGTRFED